MGSCKLYYSNIINSSVLLKHFKNSSINKTFLLINQYLIRSLFIMLKKKMVQ